MSLQFNTSDPMLGTFTIERPASNLAAPAPEQRPFERFTSDLFGFTGGLLETAGGALDLFGGPPQQQRGGRGRAAAPQPAGIDTTTALLIGGGLLALVLVIKGRK